MDAGEAGIRVSRNINIAALQVLNANNIQVQGTSTGIPVATPVNTGALTNAANTSAAANPAVPPSRPTDRASIITVEIIGFGGSDVPGLGDTPRGCPGGAAKVNGKCPAAPATSGGGHAERTPYNTASPVQVIGLGELTPEQQAFLTPEERQAITSR